MQTRPQFTVRVENYLNPDAPAGEIGYDANMLSIVRHDGEWALAFVSSGGQMVVPARFVKEVSFAPDGASWCMACDGPVPQFLPRTNAA